MHLHLIRLGRNIANYAVHKNISAKYSIYHTLNVKNQIEDKRKKAIVGGGDKRIEAQHKKVSSISIYLFVYWYIPDNSHYLK